MNLPAVAAVTGMTAVHVTDVVSPRSSSPTGSYTATPAPASETARPSLHPGAIAGIVIAVVAVVGLVALAVLVLIRRRRGENDGMPLQTRP